MHEGKGSWDWLWCTQLWQRLAIGQAGSCCWGCGPTTLRLRKGRKKNTAWMEVWTWWYIAFAHPKCSRVCALRIRLCSHQRACKNWPSTFLNPRLQRIIHQSHEAEASKEIGFTRQAVSKDRGWSVVKCSTNRHKSTTNLLQGFDFRQLLCSELGRAIGPETGRVGRRGGGWVQDLDQHGVGDKAHGADAVRGTPGGAVPVHFLEEGDRRYLWFVFIPWKRGHLHVSALKRNILGNTAVPKCTFN